MKKSLLALALLGAYGAAMAQTSVTIYGSFDAGVRYLDNVNAAGDDRFTMSSGGTSMSNRIGFKGQEDLGGGLNAHFALESGFNSGTGALDNTSQVLFNRLATVGIGGGFGSLDFGRQYTVAFKTIALYEPFAYRFPGQTHVVPATAGVRYNNDIQYTGTFGPVTVRAEHSLGEQAGSVTDASASAIGATFTSGPIAVGGAYTKRKPNVATSPATDFQDNDHFTVGAAYRMGPLRVSAGYANEEQERTTVNTEDKYAWGGVNYTLSPSLELAAAYYQQKRENATDGKKKLYILAAYYSLSKRTSLYAEADYAKYRGSLIPATTHDNQTGVSLGVNHMF